MALIEVSLVHLTPPEDPAAQGWVLDRPISGELFDGTSLEIEGWIVHPGGVRLIEILRDDHPLQRTPVDQVRPDVGEKFPAVCGSGRCGFHTDLVIPDWRPSVFTVRAATRDDRAFPIAEIVARRCWREDRRDDGPPLVSVIICCDTANPNLAQTLESALGQTYPHLEIVVVGPATDPGREALRAQYPFVRAVVADEPGPSGARNAGVRRTVGDFLVFLGEEERLLPDALRLGIEAFRQHPDAAAVLGHRSGVDSTPPSAVSSPLCPAGMCLGLFRRSALDAAGIFRSDADTAEMELIERLGRQFPLYCSHTVIVESNHDTSGVSA